MGGSQSVPEEPPSPIKELTDTPWREPYKWDAELEQTIKDDIKQLNPASTRNLLLLGRIGAGKSSFINSILSIAKERKCEVAPTGGAIDASWTLTLEWYTEMNLLKGNYLLVDSMGIEIGKQQGFNPGDVINVIKGHVRNGYTFNPIKPIQQNDTYYRPSPRLEHHTHCVIFVVDATTTQTGIPEDYAKKMRVLQEKLKEEGITRIMILTKVDRLCDEVQKDISNLFRSVKVQKAVNVASEVFGIGEASIHPVKNYETDFNIATKENIPLLLAIRQAMHYAEDRVEHILQTDQGHYTD